ncbi:hypothetical protein RIF29_43211 [Crotalaria pallida]|uniref:Uncharacterized protein n=1 Tax=Crotalaria pallida TaxID=3830 RepID=A0AAN9DZ62_CROPI
MKGFALTVKSSKVIRPFHFDKIPTPQFNSFGSASPMIIFLPPEGNYLLAGCGRGGIRTPDTVVRSHVL